jgi:hypothetical protein
VPTDRQPDQKQRCRAGDGQTDAGHRREPLAEQRAGKRTGLNEKGVKGASVLLYRERPRADQRTKERERQVETPQHRPHDAEQRIELAGHQRA